MRQGNNSRRSRGRGSGKRQPRNNQIDSHGPEVRVRGSAQQVCDKYLALARDATSSGDRIVAENMFQHAEHYSRLVAVAQESTEQRIENRDGQKNARGQSINGQTNLASQEHKRLDDNEHQNPPKTDDDAVGLDDEAEVVQTSPLVREDSAEGDKNGAKAENSFSGSDSESEEQIEQASL